MTMKKNKIKEIVFLTLRDNNGATGGPGGVLFLQKQMLGEKLLGIPCKYQFNILAGNLGKLKNILNKIPDMEEKKGSEHLKDRILKFSTTKAFPRWVS